MTQSIKITGLTNIGANIAYTTLVPVVNMSGTPETQKANLQIVGNLILDGAGGSYFPAAAQSILAQTVSNAAQPNITSVGTLTSLSTSGNLTSANANLGNLAVANFFSGDGGFLSNVYSNTSVANYLPNYAGNVGAGNVNVTGGVYSGNISSTGLSSLTDVNVLNDLDVAGNLYVNRIQNVANVQIITDAGNVNATWTFGAGGALYWPGPYQWAIEPNPSNEFEIHSHSNVVISTDTSNANLHFTFDSDGIFSAQTVIRTTVVPVASLPSAVTVGAGSRAFVSDANSTTFNDPAVGGGSNNMPVFSNGTGWFIG